MGMLVLSRGLRGECTCEEKGNDKLDVRDKRASRGKSVHLMPQVSVSAHRHTGILAMSSGILMRKKGPCFGERGGADCGSGCDENDVCKKANARQWITSSLAQAIHNQLVRVCELPIFSHVNTPNLGDQSKQQL